MPLFERWLHDDQIETNGVDLRFLGWMRAGIGALILLRTTPILALLHLVYLEGSWPLLGWPDGSWDLARLPPLALEIACIVRTITAALFMVGIATRVLGLACAASGYVVMSQQPFGFFFTIHLLYQAAILLALGDAGSTFALRPVAHRSPASSYRLLQWWVASIYAWAGIYKLRSDWWDGRALDVLRHPGGIQGSLADLFLASPWMRSAAAKGVTIFELTIGPLLLWQRTRRYALPAAYGFHILLEMTARPDLLGWGMMTMLLCFAADERSTQNLSAAR